MLGSIRPRYMMAPHTLARKLWDTAALLLIYATLVTVPLQIGQLAAACMPEWWGLSGFPTPSTARMV